MYKFPLKVALIILCSGAYASDLDKYAEVLDWRQKWEKVIARTTGNYVNRHIRGKLNGLPEAKQEEIVSKLAEGMRDHYSWQEVGGDVMQNFIDTCGSGLLDKFVGFYSGETYSKREKQELSSAYRVCGKTAIEKSMALLYDIKRPHNPEKAAKSLHKTIADILIVREAALESFRGKYLDASGHKAFAQSASGNWNWRSSRTSKEHAINNALATCRARNSGMENTQPCRVINLNGKWTDIYRRSIIPRQRDESLLMSNKALASFQQKYRSTTKDKAFAQSDNGTWSWRSSQISKSDAIEKALTTCRKHNKKHDEAFPCRIVNVNNKWLDD